ncbi:MAG: hypothetical protein ACRCX2_14045, partial [Paraclostridium sp.]
MFEEKLVFAIKWLLGLNENKDNKKERLKMTRNIRKRLLENGVEIKGDYNKVRVWLPEVEEFEGIKDFTLSERVNVTIDLATFHEGKVLDIESLFFDTDIKVAVGVSKTEVYTDKGSVITIRELFDLPIKKGTYPSKNSYVELVNCFSDNTVVTLGGIMLKSSLQSTIGQVQSVSERDGIASVRVGDKTLRLPSYCCKDITGMLFSEEFGGILNFAKDNGVHPAMDGSMWGIKQTEDGDYIEYITEARLSRFDGDIYNPELRAKFATKKKVRGVLQSIFPSMGSATMEDIIMLYCSKSANVEILTGKSMKDVFIARNCATTGSMGSSCMRDKSPRTFDIYVDSADGIAIMKNDEGKIILRAILWTLRNVKGDEQKFMDRIYSG